MLAERHSAASACISGGWCLWGARHLHRFALAERLFSIPPRKLLAWLTFLYPLAGIAPFLILSDFFCWSKLVPKRLDYRESFSADSLSHRVCIIEPTGA